MKLACEVLEAGCELCCGERAVPEKGMWRIFECEGEPFSEGCELDFGVLAGVECGEESDADAAVRVVVAWNGVDDGELGALEGVTRDGHGFSFAARAAMRLSISAVEVLPSHTMML